MDLEQLQALASSTGFPDPNLAAAIAMAESGGNPNAVGDVTLGRSIGLWQINLAAHPQYNEADLYNPQNNADAAYAISSAGQNWTPWSTYNSGAYLPFYSGLLSTPTSSSLTTSKALWISAGILAAGGAALWWMSLSSRERRRIRRMLPA